jgi:transcriptional regulator with XRE-family HTH domain
MATLDGTRRSRRATQDLRDRLGTAATTSERVRGLNEVGLPASQISRAIGVSPSTLRNWVAGQAEPRLDAAITLDDLRAVTTVLLDGGMEPERISKWLISRDARTRERPIDQIASRPTDVLTAAVDMVMDDKLANDEERAR